ncbi:RHOMBOID-like protein 12 mitochondrial [Zea mays]|uniref:RHOMBOID-like protein 12 mitochondrial n=1 Tax=Zea mays TaxID=4577 RepID=A0A1D6GB11_MAIZE|nr:RHOMBOID-like protein 12 mitochondrial [Zea mays]
MARNFSNDLLPSAANVELPFPYIFLSESDYECVWSCLSIEVVCWWSTYWISILLAGEGFSSLSETGKNHDVLNFIHQDSKSCQFLACYLKLEKDYVGWDTSRAAELVCGFLFQQHILKIAAICDMAIESSLMFDDCMSIIDGIAHTLLHSKFDSFCCVHVTQGASAAVNATMLLQIFLYPKGLVYIYFVIPVPAALMGAGLIGADLVRLKRHGDVSGSAPLGGALAAALVWARIRKGWI